MDLMAIRDGGIQSLLMNTIKINQSKSPVENYELLNKKITSMN